MRTVRAFADDRFWRDLIKAAREGRKGAAESFLDALATLRESGDLSLIREIVEGREVASRISTAFDFGGFEDALKGAYSKPMAGTYLRGAEHGLEHTPAAVRESLTGLRMDEASVAIRRHATAWAEQNAGRLAVNVTETTRQGISEVIQRSIGGNFGNRLTAGELRGFVGITPRQERILERYVRALGDTDLTAPEINRRMHVRFNQLVRARSEVIAETELKAAAVNGQRGYWRELGAELAGFLREIVAVLINSCQFCIDADGQQAELDGEYPGELGDGPLFHPICQCSERLVPRPDAGKGEEDEQAGSG